MIRCFTICPASAFALLARGFLSAIPLHAGVVGFDPVSTGAAPSSGEYAVGSVVGQNPIVAGFTGAWVSASVSATATGLTYPVANYTAASGGAFLHTAAGRTYRNMDSALVSAFSGNGTVYWSFLAKFGTAANNSAWSGYVAVEVGSNSANDTGKALAIGIDNSVSGNFMYQINNGAKVSLGVASDTATHLFVARFDMSTTTAGDSVTLWIDPNLNGGHASDPPGGVNVSGLNLLPINNLRFGAGGVNSFADEVRFGTTLHSVLAGPERPSVPTFESQPDDHFGLVGDTVTLSALAPADPTPSYQWERSSNGTSGWMAIPGATGDLYEIGAALYATNGFYRLAATNANGSASSDVVQVSLTFPSPQITQQPAPAGAEAGGNVTFTVVASGLGNLSYQWRINGMDLPGETGPGLTLTGLAEDDVGAYSVRIVDDAATAEALPATSVISDPAILILGDLADYEAGLTFRLYDIREAMDQLYPLVPGQTPNIDEKRSSIDWSGSADFAGYTGKFVVECISDLYVTTAGDHEFRLTSEDGSELWINDTLVIDHDGEHGPTAATGSITLSGGLRPLKLRFFQNAGNVALKLEWRPPGAAGFVTIPAESFLTTAGVTRVVAPGKKNIIRPGDGSRPGSGQPLNAVHPSWRVTTIHPSSFNPKVGAMAVHPDGRLFITTFNPNQNSTPDPLPGGDGKIWALTNVQGEDPQAVTVTEVAAGLSEPLGMDFINGALHVTQRTAVTRLRDTNNDGYYETKDTIGEGWSSNNYHQFHFGLIEKDGFAYSTLSTSIHFDYPGLNGPNPPNRGTLVRTNLATGEVSYLAGGLRTPNGLCFGPEGEIFQTDNQGAWMPSSRLNHLQQGHFYGHYNNTNDGGSPSLFADQPMTSPAVWFPQNEIANSPSQPLLIPDGPFAGDLLVGDITLGGINRVSLDRVRGTWQGCIYRFTQGLEGGVNRLAWGPNGTLYVGCIGGSGNWSWNGTTTGLQRLTPQQGNPVTFEIGKVTATANGFEITYTKPVPEASLETPANFTVKQWSYNPTAAYGGAKIGEEILTVSSATASADRTKVTLVIPGLEKGHVVYLKGDPVSDDGSAVLSSEVWYTLNEIPGGPFNVLLDDTSLLENQPSGTSIGTLSASHDHSGETIIYSLPAGAEDNALFSVSGETLAAAAPFDHERRSSYQVRIRATDESGVSSETTFSIQITDVATEHAPRRILLTNAVLPPDHVAGALVGRLLMDDADLGDLQPVSPSTAGSAAPEVEESFDYAAAATLTGQAGGTGFSGPWQVGGTSSMIPAGSLSYTDALGMALETSGNRGFCAPASRNSRPLATPRGADGTVITYGSFIADPGNNVHFWSVEFWNGTAADANRVLQIGNENGFGVRVRNGTNKSFPISDSGSHFVVFRIHHLPGNDQVSVWIDPPLSAEPTLPDLSFTPAETGGPINFNRIGLSDFVTTSAPALDELRLGNDWSSVTPHHAAFPRFEFASGVGDTDNAAFSIQGDRLVAIEVLSAGIHTLRVKATDSAGFSYQQPVLVWVGAGHVDSNGDGTTDATAIRLGFDPLGPAVPGAYFGQSGTISVFGRESGSGDYFISAETLPGNLYWIERSPDLAQWTLEGQSIVLPSSFLAASSEWQLPRPGDPRHFWRVAGGWPTAHGIDPLANGLAGLNFAGGSAAWTFDSSTGVLRHDYSTSSEWAHFTGIYTDFFLSLEYRLSSNGNAGIFLRATETGDPWITGSEVQVTSEPRLPIHSSGALYDRIPASPVADARALVWHRMEVLMVGHRVRVVIDGIPTVDVADVREVFPSFAWPVSGLIGFQDSHAAAGSWVEYRNIKLLSLAP